MFQVMRLAVGEYWDFPILGTDTRDNLEEKSASILGILF